MTIEFFGGGSAFRQIRDFRNSNASNNSYVKVA